MVDLSWKSKIRRVIAISLAFSLLLSSFCMFGVSLYASATMPVISLSSNAYGRVIGVTTNLKIRQSPTTSAPYSGTILNGTTVTIVGYTEYDPSDPYSPWLAIDTAATSLQKPSDYSIGYVSQVYVNVPVTGIQMTKSTQSVKVGSTIELTYNLLPPCASNKSVSWSSSDTGVASVDQYGMVSANTTGSATITVQSGDGGKTSDCVVSVQPYVNSIELNRYSDDIGVGKSESLTATVLPADAYDKTITWSSSDTAIATVSQDGIVTGEMVGTATITATANDGSGISASCEYTVRPLVSSVTLNKDSLTLSAGTNETLMVNIEPSDAFDKTVSWSSSDEKVATVDQSGKVIAISAGTATIKAVANDSSSQYDTCIVSVKSLVTNVILNKESSSLITGQSETLIATVEPNDALDRTVTWSSSDESVAVVDEFGTVTAVKGGTAVITATANDGSDMSASCSYTIEWLPSGIVLNKASSVLQEGKSEILVPIFNDDAIDRDVVWSSSDEAVATVNQSGEVMAISAGNAVITATLANGSGESASCSYVIKSLVKGITLDKTSLTIVAGQSEKLSESVFPSDAFDTTVVWSSSNEAVAAVNENGVVKGKSAGVATITVMANDGSNVVATCEITVIVLVSRISIDRDSCKIVRGNTLTLKTTVTPDTASDKSLTWSSSNTYVATVDENGVITAVNGGTAIITAAANDGSGASDSCKVTVTAPVEKIILNEYDLEMSSGEQYQLVATVRPNSATDKEIKWSSSSSAYARVDQTGKVVAKSGGVVYITAMSTDGSNVAATCEIIINYPRTGWIANIGYTSTVNVRKTPDANGEIATTAGYGRVLTVTAPAIDGWYPVVLSDGTRGYISAQFVVWEKPYDPPKMTTTTKKYIYVSKSGFPRAGWAGNRLAQTSRLSLKTQPSTKSSTVRSVPFATMGTVRGRTSNGYYVSGGNGYQIVYAYAGHVQFTRPIINCTLLSTSDKQIVTRSNTDPGCGSCGGDDEEIPDAIVEEETITQDPANVETPSDEQSNTTEEMEIPVTVQGATQAWVYKESGNVIEIFKDPERNEKLIDYGLASGTEVWVYSPPIGSSYAILWGNGEKAYVNKKYVLFEKPDIKQFMDSNFSVKFVSERGTVACFLEIARSQDGYKSDSNNNTVYTEWFKKPKGTDWCHMFVSWCADQAGILNSRVPYTATCYSENETYGGVQQFKNRTIDGHCAFHEMSELRSGEDPYKVKPGDLVYFLWDGSYDGKTTDVDHVAIVISIDIENNKLLVVEGNTPNANGQISVIYGNSRDDAMKYNQVVGIGEI